MSMYFRDGNDVRQPRNQFINDNGTVRKAKTIWANIGGGVHRVFVGQQRFFTTGDPGATEIQHAPYTGTRANFVGTQTQNEIVRLSFPEAFDAGVTQTHRVELGLSTNFNSGGTVTTTDTGTGAETNIGGTTVDLAVTSSDQTGAAQLNITTDGTYTQNGRSDTVVSNVPIAQATDTIDRNVGAVGSPISITFTNPNLPSQSVTVRFSRGSGPGGTVAVAPIGPFSSPIVGTPTVNGNTGTQFVSPNTTVTFGVTFEATTQLGFTGGVVDTANGWTASPATSSHSTTGSGVIGPGNTRATTTENHEVTVPGGVVTFRNIQTSDSSAILSYINTSSTTWAVTISANGLSRSFSLPPNASATAISANPNTGNWFTATTGATVNITYSFTAGPVIADANGVDIPATSRSRRIYTVSDFGTTEFTLSFDGTSVVLSDTLTTHTFNDDNSSRAWTFNAMTPGTVAIYSFDPGTGVGSITDQSFTANIEEDAALNQIAAAATGLDSSITQIGGIQTRAGVNSNVTVDIADAGYTYPLVVTSRYGVTFGSFDAIGTTIYSVTSGTYNNAVELATAIVAATPIGTVRPGSTISRNGSEITFVSVQERADRRIFVLEFEAGGVGTWTHGITDNNTGTVFSLGATSGNREERYIILDYGVNRSPTDSFSITANSGTSTSGSLTDNRVGSSVPTYRYDPDRANIVYRGAAIAEPSSSTTDFWGWLGADEREAAADGTFPTGFTFAVAAQPTANTTLTDTALSVQWEGPFIQSLPTADLMSASGATSTIDGNTYYIDPATTLSDAFATAVSGSNTFYYFPVRRTGFANVEASGSFSDNADVSTALMELGTAIAALDDDITWDGTITQRAGVSFDVSYDLTGLTYPITVTPVSAFDYATGFGDPRSVVEDSDAIGWVSRTTLIGTFNTAQDLAEAIRDTVSLNANHPLVSAGTINLTQTATAGVVRFVGTNVYFDNVRLALAIPLTSSVTVQASSSSTAGNRAERYIDINLGTTTNIQESATITANQGTSTRLGLMVTNGDPSVSTNATQTIVTVDDYAGMEISMQSFAADSATAPTTGRSQDIRTFVVNAINSNTETPIDFMAVDDTANNRLVLTAQRLGSVNGLFNITVDNQGVTDATHVGDFTFNATTEEVTGFLSTITINADGQTTIKSVSSAVDFDDYMTQMARLIDDTTYDADTGTIIFEATEPVSTRRNFRPQATGTLNTTSPLTFTFY